MNTRLLLGVCVGLLLAYVSPLHAQNVMTFDGTTVSAPTRTLEGFGSTPEDCGPAVTGPEPFVTYLFSVDTDGDYTFSILEPISTIPDTDDTVLILAEHVISATSICGSGFMAIGNQTPGAGLTIGLTSSTTYVLTVAGFLGTEDAFSVELEGPPASRIEDLGVLPVTLTSFGSVADDDVVTLHWTTESAVNHAGFEIQTQPGTASETDAWKQIGYIEGIANTDETQTYRFQTEPLAPGTHRFRLKSVDLDGTFTLSTAVEVAIGVPGTHQLSEAYPNPFNATTTFTLALAEPQQVRVEAFDMLGRRVALVLDEPLTANQVHRVRFGADTALSSGMYVLHITGETFAATQMVSLVR